MKIGGAAPPRAVIFDFDGVLVDSSPHHRAAWRALLTEVGVAEPPEFWRRTIGRPSEEAVPLLLDRTMAPDEARRLARLKHEHYAKSSRDGLPAVAGAPAFVRVLAARGVPIGLGTSARGGDAKRLLASLGLLDFFSVLVAAEDVRRGKPDPEVYLRVAMELGVPPAACLVFEDAAVGIEAARRAGMRVIGMTTAYPADELIAAGAERTIPDFEGCTWPPQLMA